MYSFNESRFYMLDFLDGRIHVHRLHGVCTLQNARASMITTEMTVSWLVWATIWSGKKKKLFCLESLSLFFNRIMIGCYEALLPHVFFQSFRLKTSLINRTTPHLINHAMSVCKNLKYKKFYNACNEPPASNFNTFAAATFIQFIVI